MKRGAWTGLLAIMALGVIVVAASAYTVSETEQVLITEFGKPIGDPVTEAGLHWRVPFVQKVRRFEKRLLEHEGDGDQITTREKKNIVIRTFARWRIDDPLLFFQSVRETTTAIEKLNDIIDSETRDTISRHVLLEAVRDSSRELTADAEMPEETSDLSVLPAELREDFVAASDEELTPDVVPMEDSSSVASSIQKGRRELTQEILRNSRTKLTEYGMDLVDVQIRSINYVARVQESVFSRMISERRQIAEKYRAEGQKVFAAIQGAIEKQRNRILSVAYREAETIRGEAEAEAARIYAGAYGKDPEFYSFWRTLQIYRKNLGENVTLVVGTDSDLFGFLKSAETAR